VRNREAGHAAGMEKVKNVYKMLVGNPEGWENLV
jgi:hypothetical protein